MDSRNRLSEEEGARLPLSGESPGRALLPRPRFAPDPPTLRGLKARTAELCYSAVRTLAVLPDREHLWLNRIPIGQPLPVLTPAEIQAEWGIDVAAKAQAEEAEHRRRRAIRYRPTPKEIGRCLEVLAWLTWLERERNGREERRIICARAYGATYRSIAERFYCHEDTVKRREAGGLVTILNEFHSAIEAMP